MTQVIQFKKLENNFDHYVDELASLCQNDFSLINSIILDKLDSKIPLIKN